MRAIDGEELLKRINDCGFPSVDRNGRIDRSKVAEIINKMPEITIQAKGKWNNHKVAYLLAELFDDVCACNHNGIDEWLPKKCDFAEKECPNVVGVACWEQFLKHRADMRGEEE